MTLFSGLKILDLTRVFSGPFATRHFADFGAEVIKIEPPQGDDSRRFPPLKQDWSGYFEILNRNKKSLVLDLKNPKDLQRFYKLCKKADVVVENFTPSVKKRLKIHYKAIKKLNPKIIYASVSGVSERVQRKYYDVIAQAESGFISLNGEKKDMKVSTAIIDAFSGMKLAYAVSSALYARERYQKGCQLHVSMKGSAFDLLEQNLIETSVTGRDPKKVGNMDNAIAPFGIFDTSDGALVVAAGNDLLWNRLSDFFVSKNAKFPRQKFITNHLRVKNISLLKKEMEKVLRKMTTKQVVAMLIEIDVPFGEVKTMQSVLNDKENFAEKLLEKIKHPKVGKFVVPTGAIQYSIYKKSKYKLAPKLNEDYEI